MENKCKKASTVKKNQQGLALAVLLFLIALVVTGFEINSLANGSPQIQRGVDTNQALLQAKNAVIGYVIAGLSGAASSPGQFPCPEDTSTSVLGTPNEGQAKGECGTSLAVGRFAWRTLGTGDLRDANNDRLWYALSPGFRDGSVVNSDSQGLTVDGISDQAIAILFSPGIALPNQNRSTSAAPDVRNYLDLENNNDDEKFISNSSSNMFNDQLVMIKSDEVFPVLEKRVLKDIKNYLLTYQATWQAYPFPVPFTNPDKDNSTYVGDVSATGGFLPVGDPVATWLPSTINNSSALGLGGIVGGILGGLLDPTNPASASCTQISSNLSCTLPSAAANDEIIIVAKIKNLARGFYKPLDSVNIEKTNFNLTSLKHSLNSQGNGAITLQGTAAHSGQVTVEFPLPTIDKWEESTMMSYVLENNWHHLIYYKIAQPFLPGGNKTCNEDCLTLNNLKDALPESIANVHVLLMSAGRKLDTTEARSAPAYSSATPAQTRPGGDMADYFDSANNISALLTFDNRQLPLATFNDQIEIVEKE